MLSFLRNPNADTTLSLYNFIAEIHKKGYVFNLMDDLRVYEEGFTNIIPEHRDHYLHSASVYVLGLAIYNNCKYLRRALNTERHENRNVHDQKASFLFRWSLAACLHDLAYPLELSLKSFNRYSAFLHEIQDRKEYSFININSDIYQRFNLLPIIEPDNVAMGAVRKDTALGMIANRLTGDRLRNAPITYETLLEVLEKHISDNLAIGRIDHGIFSSFIILKRVHELYKKHEWNIWDYYYEVVDAATAIFLHNSYRYSELKNIFGDGKFHYDYPSSLGYLLYLSDTLCEWFRGKKKDHKFFGVNIHQNEIIFRVPKSVKNEMKPAAELFDERIPVKITDQWTYQLNENGDT
jgi:hypothetical protein